MTPLRPLASDLSGHVAVTAGSPFALPAHRRSVLTGLGLVAGLTVLRPDAAGAGAPGARTADPAAFAHGVASGDPRPGAVLLWTRVTPTKASTPGSGKGPRVTVRWEVARDAAFRRVVRRGSVVTGPERDHTVKVDAAGLEPETWYFYRFRLGDTVSRTGRTRTAPAADATPDHLRFGVVSCANLQAGWFTAYRALARRTDLHAIVHLGDYLYEYGPGEYGYGQSNTDIRPHEPAHEMVSLADYRQRHAQYKRDADLRDLHAAYPFICTWDDHEVANDSYKDGAENHQSDTEGDYAERKATAHRVYDEWMPVRMGGTTRLGDGDRLYRRLRFGTLAELSMLDLRSYRDQQVATLAPTPVPATEAEVSDPERSITGEAQMAWLKDSLSATEVQWKIVGNPVMIAPVTFADLPDEVLGPINDTTGLLPSDGLPYNVDQWDGYTADRREVFAHLAENQVSDALFITGDIHSGWACELPQDTSTYPASGSSLGVEFVCASVTSNNLKDITGAPPRTASIPVEETIKANNRHIKYLDFDSHGFSVLDVTADRAQMDWFVLGDRAEKDTEVTWSVSYLTRAGTSAIEAVDAPVTA